MSLARNRGSSSMARCTISSLCRPLSRLSFAFSGLWGDTTNQTSSRSLISTAHEAMIMWPTCTGLNDPKNSPTLRIDECFDQPQGLLLGHRQLLVAQHDVEPLGIGQFLCRLVHPLA